MKTGLTRGGFFIVERAVIIGVFEYLGFLLCKRILEEGIEVDAVHLNQEINPMAEERRLEIGRNANFVEWDVEKFNSSTVASEKIVVFMDFMTNNKIEDALIFEKRDEFTEMLEQLSRQNGSVVVFLPFELLSKRSMIHSNIQKLIDEINRHHLSLKIFYLPALNERDGEENNDLLDALLEIATC